MATVLEFNVENDNGDMVIKTAQLQRIKDMITRSYKGLHPKTKIGNFRVHSINGSEIIIRNSKGQQQIWHYGGFDGMEVVEPYEERWH